MVLLVVFCHLHSRAENSGINICDPRSGKSGSEEPPPQSPESCRRNEKQNLDTRSAVWKPGSQAGMLAMQQTHPGLREAGFSIVRVKLTKFCGNSYKPRYLHFILDYFQVSGILEKHSINKSLVLCRQKKIKRDPTFPYGKERAIGY